MGLATHQSTRSLFNPVPDMAIVFVCVAIGHVIREYQSGRQVTAKFEGNGVNCKFRYLVIMDVDSKLIR